MPEIMIKNVPVHFPFEPYDVQRAYMEKVIDCLQSGAHGMLESPTGTGKTLSLLCSTLAWLTLKKAQLQTMRLTKGDPMFLDDLKEDLNNAAGNSAQGQTATWVRPCPKIIYASRTHSQLSQVISELKRTKYAYVRMAVIGSRDQLCTNPEVAKEENTSVKISMCQTLTSSRACHLHRNIERKKDDVAFTEAGVMDIEDLIKVCDKLRVCPYFMSRELKQPADIIFMPYNYLLDPRTRRQQDVDIANSIVILDEGHNVEKICEESASVSLSNTDVAMCISEITEVMKMYSENPVDFNDPDSDKKRDFSENELMVMKEMLLCLEKVIDDIPLIQKKDGPEAAFPGEYIFELLGKANLQSETYSLYTSLIEQIVQYLNTLRASSQNGPFLRTGASLEKLANFLRTVYYFEKTAFEQHFQSIKECFRVFVTLEKQKNNFKKNSWLTAVNNDSKPGGKVVNFWCFNPGYGMKGLLNLGVHSIIVTSGTLSPLPPLIAELGIPINITLENKHVISPHQVFVSVVRQGPDGVELISTFKNRSNEAYLTSLGRTIVNFARVIPEGLLVFFASYSVLNQCKAHWEETGIWNQISSVKQIFVEPQGKRDLKEVMDNFYSRIYQPGSKGACFLAVCRGKVSEGLDFADQNGRAVILTGLPYPPFYDPKVVMKREYLDKNKKKVTGQQWYQLEATRAVNQAVGRVIRHRHDYGAVIFCDSRFSENQTKQQMSAWLRPYIQVPNQFGAVTRGLCQFFKKARETLPLPAKKEMSVSWDEISNEPVVSRAVPAAFNTSQKSLSKSGKQGNFNWQSQSPKPVNVTPWNTPSSSIASSYSQSSQVSIPHQSSTKSMFGALEESTKVIDFNSLEESNASASSCSSALQDCTNQEATSSCLEKEGDPPEAKRRKLRMMGVPLTFDQTTDVPPPQRSDGVDRKFQMKMYLSHVRGKLSSEAMQSFNNAVKSYSKQSNLSQLLEDLDRLFDQPDHLSCIKGFDTYIKNAHKDEYAAYCRKKFNSSL